MSNADSLPSINDLKLSARELRNDLHAMGTNISHSEALERVARDQGFKDWNALSAAAGHTEPACPVSQGDRVSGRYLGQRFAATVKDVQFMEMPGRFRVTFHFDEPVDVVTFSSFSSLRQRVTCTLTADGRTAQKTSNGEPQLVLD